MMRRKGANPTNRVYERQIEGVARRKLARFTNVVVEDLLVFFSGIISGKVRSQTNLAALGW